MFTREQYLKSSVGENRHAGPANHRRYYSQFVDAQVITRVVRSIGAERLRKSTDPHFNIPLARWDRLAQNLGPLAINFKSVGDYATQAGLVCVAKEAARQWVEAQK